MGLCRGLESMSRSLFVVLRLGIMAVILCARVTFQDEIGMPTGLLCISNCATCPVICSPPPPPLESRPPPSPHVHDSPPPQSYNSHSPPPSPLPPPLPPLSPPPPPPPAVYYGWGAPPPPPYSTFPYINPSGPAQPITGPHGYSYPYYYFYSSNASFLSLHASFLLALVCSFVMLS